MQLSYSVTNNHSYVCIYNEKKWSKGPNFQITLLMELYSTCLFMPAKAEISHREWTTLILAVKKSTENAPPP